MAMKRAGNQKRGGPGGSSPGSECSWQQTELRPLLWDWKPSAVSKDAPKSSEPALYSPPLPRPLRPLLLGKCFGHTHPLKPSPDYFVRLPGTLQEPQGISLLAGHLAQLFAIFDAH